jgi:hypothetical protein
VIGGKKGLLTKLSVDPFSLQDWDEKKSSFSRDSLSTTVAASRKMAQNSAEIDSSAVLRRSPMSTVIISFFLHAPSLRRPNVQPKNHDRHASESLLRISPMTVTETR